MPRDDCGIDQLPEKRRYLQVLTDCDIIEEDLSLFPDETLPDHCRRKRHDEGIVGLNPSMSSSTTRLRQEQQGQPVGSETMDEKAPEKDDKLRIQDALIPPVGSRASSVSSSSLPKPGAVRVAGIGARSNSEISYCGTHQDDDLPEQDMFRIDATLFEEDHIPVAIAAEQKEGNTLTESFQHPSSSHKSKGSGRHQVMRMIKAGIVLSAAAAIVVIALLMIVRRASQRTTDSDQFSSSSSPFYLAAPSSAPSSSSNTSEMLPPSHGVVDDNEVPILNMSVGEFLRQSGSFNTIYSTIAQSGSDKIFDLSNTVTLFIPTDGDIFNNQFDIKYVSKQWQGHSHLWGLLPVLWEKAWRVEELMEAKQVRSVIGDWVRFNNGTVQGTPILQPNYARCLNGIIHSTDGFVMPDWLITKRTIRNELQDHFEYWYHILERLDMLDEMLSSGESQPKTLFIPSPESMEMIPNDILNDDTIMEGIVHYNYLPDLNFVVQTSFNEMEVEREDNTLLLPTAWPGQVIRATPGLLETLFLINRTMVLNDGLELADVDVLCIDGVIQVVDGLLLPPSLSNVTVGE